MKYALTLFPFLIFTIYLLNISACKPGVIDAEAQVFSMECGYGDLPKEYVKKGWLTNDQGEDKGEYRDTIRLTYDVFRPCQTLTYDTEYFDEDSMLLVKSDVFIKYLGKMWSASPKNQQEVLMGYDYDEQGRLSYEEHTSINKSLSSLWQRTSITGVLENENEIWMHPFRSNQFISLEVAPFPEIRYPLEIGNFWSGSINMGEGWGEWENETVYSYYEIVDSGVDVETEYGMISDCWLVRAKSDFKEGRSHLDLYFSPELGFVKFEYINYKKHRITISLKEVSKELID